MLAWNFDRWISSKIRFLKHISFLYIPLHLPITYWFRSPASAKLTIGRLIWDVAQGENQMPHHHCYHHPKKKTKPGPVPGSLWTSPPGILMKGASALIASVQMRNGGFGKLTDLSKHNAWRTGFQPRSSQAGLLFTKQYCLSCAWSSLWKDLRQSDQKCH